MEGPNRYMKPCPTQDLGDMRCGTSKQNVLWVNLIHVGSNNQLQVDAVLGMEQNISRYDIKPSQAKQFYLKHCFPYFFSPKAIPRAVSTLIWFQITKTKHKIGHYMRSKFFFTTLKIHTTTLPQPLHIARYIAFWPIAATPTAIVILILGLGY